jgi:3-oxoadipate enol-lactonase
MFHLIADRLVHSVSFGSGPLTLVAISGSIGNWEIWQQPMELLSQRRRVVALDHDGVGETKVPLDEITFERHIETVLGVLDRYGLEGCVLAGDSNNVAVAIGAALRQPQRIRGLVLVSGAAWGFDRPEVRAFIDAMRRDFDRTIDGFVRSCLPEANSGHLQAWLRDIIHRTGCEACCRLIESYFAVDLRERLHELQMPALVIHGALDRVHADGRADAERLAAGIAEARLVVLEEAGHVPTLSRAGQVAALLDEFMSECESRRVTV